MHANPIVAAALVAALVAPHDFARASETSEAADQSLGTAILSASVYTGCTLARGAGATGVDQYAAGICDVTFNRRIDNCGYSAVSGEPDADSSGSFSYPGGIAVRPLPAPAADTLRVRTENAVGTLLDMPFHLVVFCVQ